MPSLFLCPDMFSVELQNLVILLMLMVNLLPHSLDLIRFAPCECVIYPITDSRDCGEQNCAIVTSFICVSTASVKKNIIVSLLYVWAFSKKKKKKEQKFSMTQLSLVDPRSGAIDTHPHLGPISSFRCSLENKNGGWHFSTYAWRSSFWKSLVSQPLIIIRCKLHSVPSEEQFNNWRAEELGPYNSL